MGAVYLGRKGGAAAAVKILNQEVSRDAEAVKRFQREAQIAYKLRHRNIIEVFDHGTDEGRHYIAMEYLAAGDLQSKLETGVRPPWQESVGLAIQILNALQYAHDNGVVHRDIKPANVLLDAEGQVVLTDFGVAHFRDGTRLTQAGALIGTPEFMAPELFESGQVDHTVDTYATALVLFELLTGVHPFRGQTITETVKAVLIKTAPRVDSINPEVPSALSDIVARGISRQREDRPAAGLMARQLNELLATQAVETDTLVTPHQVEQVAVLMCATPDSEEVKSRVAAHFRRSDAQSFQWLEGGAVVLFGGALQALECARGALEQFPEESLRLSLVTGEFAPDPGFAQRRPDLGEFACTSVERASDMLKNTPPRSLRLCPPSATGAPPELTFTPINQDVLEWTPPLAQAATTQVMSMSPYERAALKLARMQGLKDSSAAPAAAAPRAPRRDFPWVGALVLLVLAGAGYYLWDLRRPGKLALQCKPNNVNLSLDMQAAIPYVSNAEIPLRPGPHVIQVEAKGFASQRLKVTIAPKKTRRINVQLKKNKPGRS
jgi:hypothetical protein